MSAPKLRDIALSFPLGIQSLGHATFPSEEACESGKCPGLFIESDADVLSHEEGAVPLAWTNNSVTHAISATMRFSKQEAS